MSADGAGTDGSAGGGRQHGPAGAGSPSRGASGPPAAGTDDAAAVEPCLRCGVPLSLRQMGCRGGHCPNCGHPYPHGDCSD